jgi:hypothetical protein
MTMRNRLTSVAFTLLALAISAPAAQAQQVQELFSNMNTSTVQTGAAGRASFSLYAPAHVTEISTYHWNNGQGAQPGTIMLRLLGGQYTGTFGPFQTRGTAGQFNRQNVNWVASVNLNLPAGVYEVFDSSPSTWSYNSLSGGRGFTKIMGYANGPNLPPVKLWFTPCSPEANMPAVFGPCVVSKIGRVWLAMTNNSVTPGIVRFVSGMGNNSGLMVPAQLTRVTVNIYSMAIPYALCQPGAGPNFNVILYDAAGQIVGQVGTFTPDCR